MIDRIVPPRTQDPEEIRRWYLQAADILNMLPDWDYRLAFDASTGIFSIGKLVTGATSGATGYIVFVNYLTATTGVLYLITVSGTFSRQ